MKKISLPILTSISIFLYVGVKRKEIVSPSEQIGLTEMRIDYGIPGAKGREGKNLGSSAAVRFSRLSLLGRERLLRDEQNPFEGETMTAIGDKNKARRFANKSILAAYRSLKDYVARMKEAIITGMEISNY